MPQPLKSVKPGAAIFIANDENWQRTLERRPLIAIRAMQVISAWSLVEYFLLDAYVQLLGGANDLAAAKFVALNSATKKREAIAQLREKVPYQLHQLFDKMLKDVAAAEKFRDKLAHWVWAYSPDLEDHLLTIDPRRFVLEGANPSNTYCINADELDRVRAEYRRIAMQGPCTIKPPGWPITRALIPEGYPPFHHDDDGEVVFD